MLDEKATKPLRWPEDWPGDDPECPCKKVASLSSYEKSNECFFCLRIIELEKMENIIHKRLEERKFPFEKTWSEYPELLEIALEIRGILKEFCYGFYPNFIPEDSYLLIGQWITGDLVELELIDEIGGHYGIIFPPYFDFFDKSMMEFIEYIKENRASD